MISAENVTSSGDNDKAEVISKAHVKHILNIQIVKQVNVQ